MVLAPLSPEDGGRGLLFYSRSAEGTGQSFRRQLRDLFRRGAKSIVPFDRLTVEQRVTFDFGADSTLGGDRLALPLLGVPGLGRPASSTWGGTTWDEPVPVGS